MLPGYHPSHLGDHAAVRLDLAVVPVRPEAWFGYAMSWIAPSMVRATGQPFTAERARTLGDRVLGNGSNGRDPRHSPFWTLDLLHGAGLLTRFCRS